MDRATKDSALRQKARDIRRAVLTQSKRANVGHIGSNLCVADILACLYGEVLRGRGPEDPDRDRFVLSKGHAALALYAALCTRGWLAAEVLETFCADGTMLGVHPEHALTGVDFSTGSLGLGLSYGAGAALAARLQRSQRRVYVLLSDAELNEGSTWEAIMYAGHHRLGNLTAVIDCNGQQAIGFTKEVLDLSPLQNKFEAFNWRVFSANGNDCAELSAAFEAAAGASPQPAAVIASTVFGKGVSFMERQIKWHYWPMSEAEYRQALAEVG